MKRFLSYILLGAMVLGARAQPSGLWANRERLVLFPSDKDALMVVLKCFYGNYYDMAGGAINDTTSSRPCDIALSIKPIYQDEESFQGELYIDKAECIPFAIIGGSLYLDFATVEEEGRYLKAMGDSQAIARSPLYTEAKATFSAKGKDYSVPKYIATGGRVYTCTNGRETKIRNVSIQDAVQPLEASIAGEAGEDSKLVYNKNRTLVGLGEPYLSRIDTKGEDATEYLRAMVAERNGKPPIVSDAKVRVRQAPY